MKRILLVTISLCIAGLVHAQTSPIDRVFDKYNGTQGYTTVLVTKSMFELFSSMADDKEDKDFNEITSRLNSIKILSCECTTTTGAAFYKELCHAVATPMYQDLMLINDGGETVKFVIHKTGDRITELVMITGGTDACMISLSGDIDLKQVSKLSHSMNIKGLEHLSSVDQKKK